MIREATFDDVPQIVAMGLRFQALTTYAKHLNATAESLTTLGGQLISNEQSVIWLAEKDGAVIGMLAAAIYAQPMSGELIGTEICWWMDPEARGGRAALRLLKTAEQWAKERGATMFQMMAPTDEVGALYDRLGFERIEVHYQRKIA